MSTRSNESRFGAPREEAPPAAPITGNNGLNFVVPTELVDLPSQGKFYPPDHVLYNVESVEMKHMTTREEDILTSESFVKKGVALDRMLESLLVDKRINIDDLLIGDKNALLIAARVHGYGADYNTNINCPSCASRQTYTFDMGEVKHVFPDDEILREYDITITTNSTFKFLVPKAEYNVEIKMLDGHYEKDLLRIKEHKKKKSFQSTETTDFLRSIIVSVNDVTDPAQLNQFINSLPALYSRYIRRVYDSMMPGVDMNLPFKCTACTYEGSMEVPLGVNFFWSRP